MCSLLDGLDALTAAGVRATGRIALVGGGARSEVFPQSLADLSGRTVDVPDAGTEWVALGAPAQAAAVAAGRPVEGVARDWAEARSSPRAAGPTIDAEVAATVRAAYAGALR